MVEMITSTGLIIVYLADFIAGDPEWSLHPIRIIGNAIAYLEKGLRSIHEKVFSEKIAGVILCAITVSLVYGITWLVIYLSHSLNSYFGSFISIVMAYFTISVKSLGKSAQQIIGFLKKEDDESARKYLSCIVGRDTMALNRSEIIRATVETVAENTSDGVVAPLFYLILGGPPLAMAYKAVNTLDSMVGYKNERYGKLGWASARCDDLVNFIPARITGILITIAALLLKLDWKNAYSTMRSDAKKHASPNSGYPESAVAGALQVRLGGENYYEGIPKATAYLGTQRKLLSEGSISDVVQILHLTSAIMVLIGVIILEVVQ
jgi:adenosylcobinamide-phosphate synthase